jgi:hypothetical protein
MSTSETRVSNSRSIPLVRITGTERITSAADPSPANTPYWLLWSTGVIAFVLGILAFVLWGINGAGTLFDMMVALCT